MRQTHNVRMICISIISQRVCVCVISSCKLRGLMYVFIVGERGGEGRGEGGGGRVNRRKIYRRAALHV